MKTHTIRNKRSQSPILSFTPQFLDCILQAEPEAADLVLAWFSAKYKELTGARVTLDSEQTRLLLSRVGADDSGTWTSRFAALPLVQYKMKTVFEKGFVAELSGLELESALEVANAFYKQLATNLPG